MKRRYTATPDRTTHKRTKLLSSYGRVIASYKGRGELTLASKEVLACNFEAGQLAAGNVLLLCDIDIKDNDKWGQEGLALQQPTRVTAFKGVTSKGGTVTAEGPFRFVNYLPQTPQRSYWMEAFQIAELVVTSKLRAPLGIARFGLTNLRLRGTHPVRDGKTLTRSLPLVLQDDGNTQEVHLVPIAHYEKEVDYVSTAKTVGVTCEAIVPLAGRVSDTQLIRLVDNLCYVLSVARGTKVQWLYRHLTSLAGRTLVKTHWPRKTKAFSPLEVIDSDLHLTGDRRFTERVQPFVEMAYPVYCQKRDVLKLNRGPIDAYLDAKAEQDYLEMRAAKLAVVMEMIKAVFLKSSSMASSEHALDPKVFELVVIPQLQAAIRGALRNNTQVTRSARQSIADANKLLGLNRKSFSGIVRRLFRQLELTITDHELRLFVQCRNSLVHQGDFYCRTATQEQRVRVSPLGDVNQEYFFLLHMLDRVFLRVLQYKGPYRDWSRPDGKWPRMATM